MQTIKFIDSQLVTRYVVQMWFKESGNNFHVSSTKTDLDYLKWCFRKLAQPIIKGTKNGGNDQEQVLFPGQKRNDSSGFIRIRQLAGFTTDYLALDELRQIDRQEPKVFPSLVLFHSTSFSYIFLLNTLSGYSISS